ncbi:hypothetical protein RQP46_004029 [Phenoliferia psychrophenolica]
MQNGFAGAAYPLLSGQAGGAFNPAQLISSSTEAVIRADHHNARSTQSEASTSALPPPASTNGGKKRPRPSQPTAAAESPAADGDDEETKARKRRLALSCLNCRHRKIKCDRKQPCSSCIRWDDDPDQSNAFALNSDVRHIARRLAHLESLFQATNPGLMPRDPTTGSSLQTSPTAFDSPTSPHRRGTLLEDAIMRDDVDEDGRPRSAVRLGLDLAVSTMDLPGVRSLSMKQIFAVLPGKEISEFLMRKYFSEMDWDFQPIDSDAFYSEHDRYREMLMEGREDQIDPLWVAVFCMVLALSLEGFWSRPTGAKDLGLFRGLSEKELQDLPSVWHDAALRALQLGEWGGTPRIRTIQTVILFGQYIQISSSSGQQGRFLGWAASAIRIAQRMGLHRLGSNPEIMPLDDPALPPGKNSLKREMGVRLFNMLVCIDSLLSDATHRCYLLHPSQYNTARPTNLNTADLSRTTWQTIVPHPLSVHTDASFEIAHCHIAAQVRQSLDNLVNGILPFSYNRVLEQDREFKLVFENLPEVFSDRCPPVESVRLRYQRALLHGTLYARLIRLHRPFLSRGYNAGSQFRFSTEECVKAARLVIASNYGVLQITSSLWWIYTSTLAASLVLFMDLFHSIDTDAPEASINEKKDVLLKSSLIFNTQVTSPALREVVEQGRRILDGLFVAEESRRMNRAAHTLISSSGQPSEVLHRIGHQVSADDPDVAAPAPAFVPAATSQVQVAPYTEAPQADASAFEYWGDGGLGSAPPQDFTSFFDTLASEDWTAAFGTGTGSDSGAETGLLGQMAATW